MLYHNKASQDFEDHVKRTQEPNRRRANWQNVGQSGLQQGKESQMFLRLIL